MVITPSLITEARLREIISKIKDFCDIQLGAQFGGRGHYFKYSEKGILKPILIYTLHAILTAIGENVQTAED